MAFGLADEAEAARNRPLEGLGIHPWNWPVFRVWAAVWSAWRWVSLGMAGARRAGIDWQQVVCKLDLMGVPRDQWQHIDEGLRVMETEALKTLASIEN
ncbi:MAG: DUF1799 domain-containing protein [Zoogloea sp.]|nr:DUF1799 domain-containing protein [Zoogloea sp.]